jgi:methylated-DNA-[protein]-cysteine S-methyltransferase
MKGMHTTISSPIGDLTLHVDERGALTRIDFGGGGAAPPAVGEAAAVTDGAAAAGPDGKTAAGDAAAAAGPDGKTAAGDAAAALDVAAAQLREYFARDRIAFDLPLKPSGNAFEHRVWDELARIPYGETASYTDIANRIGRPGAARAVGRANARNPIAIVVPCHRVIGSDGSLTGYAGGLDSKRALLALEAAAAATSASPAAVRR